MPDLYDYLLADYEFAAIAAEAESRVVLWADIRCRICAEAMDQASVGRLKGWPTLIRSAVAHGKHFHGWV